MPPRLKLARTGPGTGEPPVRLANAEIAHLLSALAQLLASQRENPYKVRAYRRAAETIRNLPESVDDLVRSDADLTAYAGIGEAMAGAIREIVQRGTLGKLERLRAGVAPEIAAMSEYPRLDPRRVLQAYEKLNISTVPALREKLESGEVAAKLGVRMDRHFRQALAESEAILLYDADERVPAIKRFLVERCGCARVEAVGDYRRRVEVLHELSFLVETADFAGVISSFARHGGGAGLVRKADAEASFRLGSGLLVTIGSSLAKKWGLALIAATGADAHLDRLEATGARLEQRLASREAYPSEAEAYRKLGLDFIPPELREGRDEVELAASGSLPRLIEIGDIRGELHAHTTSSDGAQTIEEMVEAARAKNYAYLGITDHSQSLKIAGGVSVSDLKKQLRRIDRLNERLDGFRILKSAEVDILADGSLDYPDELLRELDYTVCSIHSRFGLDRTAQTSRVLRAMDNPYFTILGHATGRLLLRRPGYELDLERVIAHARGRGCFLEINSSPDRLDLSAENARLTREAGVKIAICTDAHRASELDWIRGGIDQARRAGLEKGDVLNCLGWPQLQRAFKKISGK